VYTIFISVVYILRRLATAGTFTPRHKMVLHSEDQPKSESIHAFMYFQIKPTLLVNIPLIIENKIQPLLKGSILHGRGLSIQIKIKMNTNLYIISRLEI